MKHVIMFFATGYELMAIDRRKIVIRDRESTISVTTHLVADACSKSGV